MTNMPVDYHGFYFMTEPFADGYYKTGNKKAARELTIKLMQKCKENLIHYKSLPKVDQNALYSDIYREIEGYRRLLHILKDNGDIELYNSNKVDFNRLNQAFRRFETEDE